MSGRRDDANENLALGIDLGTGSVKCVLLDRTGVCVASASRPFSTSYPAPGHAEQDPEEWYAAVRDAVRELVGAGDRGARVVAVGLCGAAHIPVFLDQQRRIIRPAILWTDQRSAGEAAQLAEAQGEYVLAATYNWPSCTWTLPQLMWVRAHEPESVASTRHLLMGKDYITYRLTGQMVADQGSAASLMLSDVRTHEWHEGFIGMTGVDLAAFPPIRPPHDVVGTLHAAAAADLGLPPATPVIAGALDSVSELVGLGITREGESMLRLGTAGGVMIVGEAARPMPGVITYPFLDRGWCSQAFTNSCATALQWIRSVFGGSEEEVGVDPSAALSFDDLDALAAKVPPGADGLLFHPYLLGERAPHWDPKLRASFTGLAMTHKRPHFIRSVLEGVAFSMRECRDVFVQAGYALNTVKLTGGGARSALWRQIVCDVLGTPMIRTGSNDSAIGVAMLAAVGVGMFRDIDEAARRCAHDVGKVLPDAARHQAYEAPFAAYQQVCAQLKPVYQAWPGRR